jgi:transcriptional regulator with XRE-family HTH domain
MEKKSLRMIARELNASHSYLSQVLNGKRPASEKVACHLLSDGLIERPLSAYNERESQRSSVVEQRFRKPRVVGSNPIAGSILKIHQNPYYSLFKYHCFRFILVSRIFLFKKEHDDG